MLIMKLLLIALLVVAVESSTLTQNSLSLGNVSLTGSGTNVVVSGSLSAVSVTGAVRSATVAATGPMFIPLYDSTIDVDTVSNPNPSSYSKIPGLEKNFTAHSDKVYRFDVKLLVTNYGATQTFNGGMSFSSDGSSSSWSAAWYPHSTSLMVAVTNQDRSVLHQCDEFFPDAKDSWRTIHCSFVGSLSSGEQIITVHLRDFGRVDPVKMPVDTSPSITNNLQLYRTEANPARNTLTITEFESTELQ